MESQISSIANVNSPFKAQLRQLIGNGSVSAFARKVNLGESLIRKYLNGSDPGLSKVVQIALACDVSVEWLAFGGHQTNFK